MLSVFLYAIHKNCSAKKRAELDEYFREQLAYVTAPPPPLLFPTKDPSSNAGLYASLSFSPPCSFPVATETRSSNYKLPS
jgi:hypothetical protein